MKALRAEIKQRSKGKKKLEIQRDREIAQLRGEEQETAMTADAFRRVADTMAWQILGMNKVIMRSTHTSHGSRGYLTDTNIESLVEATEQLRQPGEFYLINDLTLCLGSGAGDLLEVHADRSCGFVEVKSGAKNARIFDFLHEFGEQTDRQRALIEEGKRHSNGLEAALIEARLTSLFAMFAKTTSNQRIPTLGPVDVPTNVFDAVMEDDLRNRIDNTNRQLRRYAKIGRIPVLLMKLNRVGIYAASKCGSVNDCRDVIRDSEDLDDDLTRLDAPALLRTNIAYRVVLRSALAGLTTDSRYLCETFDVAEKAIAIPNTLVAFEDYKKIITTYHDKFSLKQFQDCADSFKAKFGRPMVDEEQLFDSLPKSTWKQ